MSLALMVKAGCFVVLTAGIVWLSLPALRHRGSHGYYRFFAWEAIALLVVMNARMWLVDPFSLRQIGSWALLTLSAGLVLEGVRLLHLVGRPRRTTADSGDYAFEQTTHLVTTGVYRWIRHPMYSSLLLLAWAIFLKDPSILGAAAAVAASGSLLVTARADEREATAKFGDAYVEYMRTTKRFVPLVW